MSGKQHLADARRRAEEALAEWKRAWILGCADTPAGVATAAIALKSGLEALLAAGPEAPPPPSDEVREAAERTRYATAPDRGDNRVPYCSEQCPQHDGKRCRIMGVRPSSICEPEVLNLLADLAARGGE